MTQGTDLTSFYQPSNFGQSRFKNELIKKKKVSVKISTLNDFCSKYSVYPSSSSLLKLDTQGYDLNVLKGSCQVIDQFSIIITELSFKPIYHNTPSYLDIINYLNNKNFILDGLFPICRDHSNFRLIEADGVFLNKFLFD